MIEELSELPCVSLKQVNGSTGAGDGADQIGTGLGSEGVEGVLLGIGEGLQLDKN
jgi:hypothetical protein